MLDFLKTLFHVSIILVIFVVLFYIYSLIQIKKRSKSISSSLEKIKVGKTVAFAGGLIGVIKKIDGDILDIEISKGVIIQATKYSVNSILEEK